MVAGVGWQMVSIPVAPALPFLSPFPSPTPPGAAGWSEGGSIFAPASRREVKGVRAELLRGVWREFLTPRVLVATLRT
jgi:hypothetical protein